METKKLDYETAYRAVHGDRDAQAVVLDYYDSYINALATVTKVTSNGHIIHYVDENLKATIQAEYLKSLPNCKFMKG